MFWTRWYVYLIVSEVTQASEQTSMRACPFLTPLALRFVLFYNDASLGERVENIVAGARRTPRGHLGRTSAISVSRVLDTYPRRSIAKGPASCSIRGYYWPTSYPVQTSNLKDLSLSQSNSLTNSSSSSFSISLSSFCFFCISPCYIPRRVQIIYLCGICAELEERGTRVERGLSWCTQTAGSDSSHLHFLRIAEQGLSVLKLLLHRIKDHPWVDWQEPEIKLKRTNMDALRDPKEKQGESVECLRVIFGARDIGRLIGGCTDRSLVVGSRCSFAGDL